jgi:hypothetical protein
MDNAMMESLKLHFWLDQFSGEAPPKYEKGRSEGFSAGAKTNFGVSLEASCQKGQE